MINTVVGEKGGGEQVEIGGEGQFEDEPFKIHLSAGSLTKLQEADIPYPVDLEISLGETMAKVEGTLTRPLELAGVDLNLSISG